MIILAIAFCLCMAIYQLFVTTYDIKKDSVAECWAILAFFSPLIAFYCYSMYQHWHEMRCECPVCHRQTVMGMWRCSACGWEDSGWFATHQKGGQP